MKDDKNNSDENDSNDSTTTLYNSVQVTTTTTTTTTTTNNTNDVIGNTTNTCHGKWMNQVEITVQQQKHQQVQKGVTTTILQKSIQQKCSNSFTIQKNDTIRLSLYKISNNNNNNNNNSNSNNNLILSSTSILQVTNTCSICSRMVSSSLSTSSTSRNGTTINNNNISNDNDDNKQQQLIPIFIMELHPILYEILYQLYQIVDTDNNSNNNNNNVSSNNNNVVNNFVSNQQQQYCSCYIIPIPNDINNDTDYEIVHRYQTEPMMIGTIEVISTEQQQYQYHYHHQRQLLYDQINSSNDCNTSNSAVTSTKSSSILELPFNSILHLYIMYYEMMDDRNNNYDKILYSNDNDKNDDSNLLIIDDITRNQIKSSFQNRIICTNNIMLLSSSSSVVAVVDDKRFIQQQPQEHQWKYIVITIQNIDINGTVEILDKSKQHLNQQNYFINDPWRYQYEIITTVSTDDSDSTTKDHPIEETEIHDNFHTVGTSTYSVSSSSSCSGYETKVQEIIQIIQIKFHSILENSTVSFSSSTSAGASPTALLITGCSGVGKTTITNEAVRILKTNTTTTIICHKVSTYDLLLQAGWSTIDHILDMLLPMSIKKQNQPTIIIVDDLNAISKSDTDDNDNNTSIEIQLVCNAIRQFIDQINYNNNTANTTTGSIGTWTTTTFLIGITQTSQLLPNELLKFGRFEKEITIVPPTQYQRECIFENILQQLVLVPSCNNNTTGSATANVSSRNNCNTADVLDASNTCREKRWAELLATITPGCVAIDCYRLCSDAYNRARSRCWYNSSSVSTVGTGTVENDNDMCKNIDIENYLLSLDISSNNQQQQNEEVQIHWSDFVDAANDCIPSQLIDLDVVKPIIPFTNSHNSNGKTIDEWQSMYNDCWKIFVGYDSIKKRLYRTVVIPWKRSLLDEWQTNFEISRTSTASTDITVVRNQKQNFSLVQPPSGVLFHGVSGCGKTIAALNLGNSLGLPIIKVGTSDVLNKWLGGSEAIVRSLFARARSAAPCILFFDEIDAIACNRSTDAGNDDDNGGGSGGSDVMNRLLSTLLNEMDGISGSGTSSSIEQDGINCSNRVLVIACTNRIESLDAALLRAGRLEEHILVDYPTIDDIQQILQYYYRKIPLDKDVNLNTIASALSLNYNINNSTSTNRRKNVTCADIVGITRESVFCALRRMPPDDNDDANSNTNTGDNQERSKLNLPAVSVCKQDIDKAIASLKL